MSTWLSGEPTVCAPASLVLGMLGVTQEAFNAAAIYFLFRNAFINIVREKNAFSFCFTFHVYFNVAALDA